MQKRCSKTLVSLRLTPIVGRISDFFEPNRSRTASATRDATTQRNYQPPSSATPPAKRVTKIEHSLSRLVTFSNSKFASELVTLSNFENRQRACNVLEAAAARNLRPFHASTAPSIQGRSAQRRRATSPACAARAKVPCFNKEVVVRLKGKWLGFAALLVLVGCKKSDASGPSGPPRARRRPLRPRSAPN